MERSLADELYSDTLQLSKLALGPMSTANSKQSDSQDYHEDDLWLEDGSSWNGSIKELDHTSDLDREWHRRRYQFHTIGYRDGLMAGKETSAQEGFNIGFRESVSVGFNWGLVRGITSALACVPDGLRERLVETPAKRNKFQSLYEVVHSLPTTDALKLFNDDLTNKPVERRNDAESSSRTADLPDHSPNGFLLKNYYEELQSIILESPAIKVHSETHQ
ncbi:unnamed protein product [Ilex paraguariensis]|uniref:Essential protein Yae1 N-terminal domain-containing protein n=1 Tax=Ilex paraguariensis TaxID=185542 RepID=A0ABC8U460_9AQUA